MTFDEINSTVNEICKTASFCGSKDNKKKCDECPVYKLSSETKKYKWEVIQFIDVYKKCETALQLLYGIEDYVVPQTGERPDVLTVKQVTFDDLEEK